MISRHKHLIVQRTYTHAHIGPSIEYSSGGGLPVRQAQPSYLLLRLDQIPLHIRESLISHIHIVDKSCLKLIFCLQRIGQLLLQLVPVSQCAEKCFLDFSRGDHISLCLSKALDIIHQKVS